MAKTKNQPLRFIVTGALLVGPAIQGCDEPVEPNEPYEIHQPTENEAPPPPPPPAEPIINEIEPPPGQEPPPDEEPAVAPEPARVDDGSMGTGALRMRTNAVAPTATGMDDELNEVLGD